jgi:hypothetical protein
VRPAIKTDNLTAIYVSIVQKVSDHRRLPTLQAFTTCLRDNFICLFFTYTPLVGLLGGESTSHKADSYTQDSTNIK